jgi:hypothetical protein
MVLTSQLQKVSLRGPGELHDQGRGDNSGLPFFRACFRALQIEYSPDLIRNVLADATGAAFDRWLHVSVLSSYDSYNRG